MPTLADLGLAGSPLVHPLDYPGRSADGSVLLAEDRVAPIPDGPGHADLDEWLVDRDRTPLAGRRAVLAVGSNAAPAQLLRKFRVAGVSTVVPLLRARVHGLHVGHSAHVSRPGYVPAAAVADRRAAPRVAVLVWVDPAQVAALDATEPNYRRRSLPPGVVVEPRAGPSPDALDLYASRHGLLGRPGRPFPLADQRRTIRRVLGASASVRDLVGTTATDFVAACAASAATRAAVRDALVHDGLVTTSV